MSFKAVLEVIGAHPGGFFSTEQVYNDWDELAMGKTSEAQKRAVQKWREKNKDKVNLQRHRSSTRSYLRHKATLDELDGFEAIIAERREQLLNETSADE